jgi:GntR family transcriptional repressor for pyruvate dehydrogenase complex
VGLPWRGLLLAAWWGIFLYKAIQTSRLYEQIVLQIEEAILKGELCAGTQLPAERDLAKQFGVSRTAVREAIKALQEKGLVDAFPGRGTFITNGTSNSMRRSLDRIVKNGEQGGGAYLVEVREMLEPEIAALAATRADAEDLAAMREAVEVMDKAAWDSNVYIEADLDFHLALAEAAANPIVLSLIDSIVGLLREQRFRIFRVEGGPDRGQQHHRRILEAIQRHDAQGARSAMQDHLSQVREDSRNTQGN